MGSAPTEEARGQEGPVGVASKLGLASKVGSGSCGRYSRPQQEQGQWWESREPASQALHPETQESSGLWTASQGGQATGGPSASSSLGCPGPKALPQQHGQASPHLPAFHSH